MCCIVSLHDSLGLFAVNESNQTDLNRFSHDVNSDVELCVSSSVETSNLEDAADSDESKVKNHRQHWKQQQRSTSCDVHHRHLQHARCFTVIPTFVRRIET